MKRASTVVVGVVSLLLGSVSALAQNEKMAPAGGDAETSAGAGSSGAASPSDRSPGAEPGAGAGIRETAPGPSPRESAKPEARDQTMPKAKSGDQADSEGRGKRGDKAAESGKATGSDGNGLDKSASEKAGSEKAGAEKTAKSKADGSDTSAASGRSEGTEGAGKAGGESIAQLSGDQKTKVQSSFRSHKSGATVKNLNIEFNVGVAVPRSVTLYAVPEDVVIIVPAYRRYKYFVVDDRVVIVDPVTFEIVDVLILA